MLQNQDVRLEVQKLRNLPPLPQASASILASVNNPDISLDRLASALSTSPILVARLLGMANSAYFGRAGQVKTVREAIIKVLGLDLVRSLVLSIIFNMELDTSRCQSFDSERFWTQTMITASLAQKITKDIKHQNFDPAVAYTAGLLLNIGLLATIYLQPIEMNNIFISVADSNESIANEVENLLGYDHYQVGYILMGRWRIPELYRCLVNNYNNHDYRGDYFYLVKLLRECSAFSNHIYRHNEYESLLINNPLQAFGVSAIHLELSLAEVYAALDEIRGLAKSIDRK